ncbi:hypothetical ISPpu15, transposase [Photobacterium sp. SKA34]|nr:hypothetical ISPpu15, transposase [Photobacterium sp. SKA34]
MVVQADETPLNVLKEEKQCYMWLYCSGADSPEAALPNVKNIALYDYQNSRARACPVASWGITVVIYKPMAMVPMMVFITSPMLAAWHMHGESSWRLRSFKVKVSQAKQIKRWPKSRSSMG